MEKTYAQYRKEQEKIANDLPLFFAFSNEQFKKAMEERGLKETDTDKIYKISGVPGGFYLRSDAPIIKAWLNREDELPVLMQDPEFAQDAFYYEMCNHEYGINWQGDWDVCNCFSDTELPYNEEYRGSDYLSMIPWATDDTFVAYLAAKQKYRKDAEENEWF